MELDDATYDRVTDLSDRGNLLMDRKQYAGAIPTFEEALNLLPLPKEQWEAWTWLAGSIGDAFYQQARYHEANVWFNEALKGPDGLGNPFLHLRLGQIALQRGDEKRAVDEFLRAYMGDGERAFDGNAPDLVFLRSKVDL